MLHIIKLIITVEPGLTDTPQQRDTCDIMDISECPGRISIDFKTLNS